MYLNAMEFLEEERDAWRPFEALAAVPDERMDEPVDGAHGWSARDLIAHLVGWQGWALEVAKDLAMNETSASAARLDALWDERGDLMNSDIQAEWRSLPLAEVRSRLESVPGDLRGHLTMVPEVRWIKHPANLKTFIDETMDHYADHAADLKAILGSMA
ncbi:MAG: maleylpyruvate isomerase N-terminal domain-containing protein [Chloroflexi bacterium]|nr:maleylpyruvate isomerase N-terminal domain-containing protein [Chloroflexota bacterium]